MGRYAKGANFERELVRLFWDRGWVALRTAGSGSTPHAVPDVLALRESDVVSVECKSTSRDKLSLKGAVLSLKEFADIAGGRAYIAVRFPREKPRFYELKQIISKGNYTIKTKDKYLSIDAITGKQNLL
ncbi:MAG: Holliday junction resolvase Hjc [Candidatus Altiarchaeota archaeon]|nr:Holliday junction resolvase Hjc [Candidatus Altiarchaeota archaeon]